MKKIFGIILIFSLVFSVPGCGDVKESSRPEKSGSRGSVYGATRQNRALDFELPDLNGQPVKLSKYRGKVILLNFFATWCPPCKREMPDFNELATEYKGRLEVVAVNVGRENPEAVRNFKDKNGFVFPILMDDGRAAGLYGPMPGIPVTVIIDRDFNVVKRFIGMRTKDVLLAELKGIL